MSDSEGETAPPVKEEAVEITDLSNSDVTTKYQEAARIVNLALGGVLQQVVAGARVSDICTFGDNVVTQSVERIFRNKVKGKAVDKGLAFPTCVSVNETVSNNSPLESEANLQPVLAEGDLVKVELGCHIDGYIAVVGHTVKVGAPTPEAPATGKEADVMLACYQAADVAVATLVAGGTNTQVAEAVRSVAAGYGVNIVSGTKIQQLKRYVINASKTVVLREDDDKPEPATFETNEVYCVSVAMSSGEGKPRESELPANVYKRLVDKKYRLKLNASRSLFNEVNEKFPTLPFSLRALSDERQVRLGLKECVTHELLEKYPVTQEHVGDAVAVVKFTVLLLGSGTLRITGQSIDYTAYKSEKVLEDELKAKIAEAAEKKKKKKKNKKPKAEGETAAEES